MQKEKEIKDWGRDKMVGAGKRRAGISVLDPVREPVACVIRYTTNGLVLHRISPQHTRVSMFPIYVRTNASRYLNIQIYTEVKRHGLGLWRIYASTLLLSQYQTERVAFTHIHTHIHTINLTVICRMHR